MLVMLSLTRLKNITFFSLVFFYFSLDFANYLFYINGEELSGVGKLLPELLFVTLLIKYIMSALSSGCINVEFIILLAISAIGLLIGVSNGSGVLTSILDWRDLLFPILFSIIIVKSKSFDMNTLRNILQFVVLLVFINSLIAIYQYCTFSGLYVEHWRYQFLLDLNLKLDPDYPARLAQYQVMRNGNLRASGVFISALSNSFITCLMLLYCIISSIYRKKTRFIWVCASLVLFAGLYVSQVRASFFMLLISLATLFFLFKYSSVDNRLTVRAYPKIAILSSVLLSILMLLYIFFKGDDDVDASALGRIAQYVILFNDFTPFGKGLGSYKGNFDSYYIYALMTLGFPCLIVLYSLVKKYYLIFTAFRAGNNYKVEFAFLYAALPSLFFLMSFQHVAGSLYYLLTVLMLSVCFDDNRQYISRNSL